MTETGTALPTPARRDNAPRGLSLDIDSENGGETSSGAESSSAAGERQRMPRRRSIVQSSSSRPAMPQSATTSLIPRVPSSANGLQQMNESSSSTSLSSRAAPVWDHEDEENLPSPFVKRNVDFSAYARPDRGVVGPAGILAANIAGKGANSSLTAKPRTSMISKALKASGEAQKALARRQAEGKTSVS